MGFIPTFEKQAVVNTMVNGKPWPNILNMDYFATEETATYMMQRFGAHHIREGSYLEGFAGDLNSDAPPKRALVWRDGFEMNAGVLAAFYKRNPEEEFPGLAAKMVIKAIGQAHEFWQMMNDQN